MGGRYEAKKKVKEQVRKLTEVVDSKFTNKNWLKTKTRRIINEYLRNGGVRPVSEIPKELDLMQRLLVKTHENIERQKAKNRTREEWAEIELEYIPPDPSYVPEGYRVCECWNCSNTFPQNGKQKYCSNECAQEQLDARKRLIKTGTYLAPKRDNYIPNREENTGIKDKHRLIYTDDLEKYFRYVERRKDGNRPYSPNRNPDKPAKRIKVKYGETGSRDEERRERYEAFKRGETPGVFTVNIKTGLKIYHTNGKKHEYSGKGSSIGA
ncbi:hypothetical protein MHI39_07260 [Heyndrickxia sp. FSL K6-6286]|uniref:hypothetical protein n=1 Tax=Heyndrickxia sp. FSL K6-6286 TaxID=2921510 RepID=UPI00315B0C5E